MTSVFHLVLEEGKRCWTGQGGGDGVARGSVQDMNNPRSSLGSLFTSGMTQGKPFNPFPICKLRVQLRMQILPRQESAQPPQRMARRNPRVVMD